MHAEKHIRRIQACEEDKEEKKKGKLWPVYIRRVVIHHTGAKMGGPNRDKKRRNKAVPAAQCWLPRGVSIISVPMLPGKTPVEEKQKRKKKKRSLVCERCVVACEVGQWFCQACCCSAEGTVGVTGCDVARLSSFVFCLPLRFFFFSPGFPFFWSVRTPLLACSHVCSPATARSTSRLAFRSQSFRTSASTVLGLVTSS